MRISPEPTAAGLQRELTDADRARIDARMARFGVAQEFAEAGMIIGEDYRKVSQLYEQLSAQARDRGETLPSMDVWLQQRAQERLAQGYRPTIPAGLATRPFAAVMSETAVPVAGTKSAAAAERAEAAPVAHSEPAAAAPPAGVDGLLAHLALGQKARIDAVDPAGGQAASLAIASAAAAGGDSGLAGDAVSRMAAAADLRAGGDPDSALPDLAGDREPG